MPTVCFFQQNGNKKNEKKKRFQVKAQKKIFHYKLAVLSHSMKCIDGFPGAEFTTGFYSTSPSGGKQNRLVLKPNKELQCLVCSMTLLLPCSTTAVASLAGNLSLLVGLERPDHADKDGDSRGGSSVGKHFLLLSHWVSGATESYCLLSTAH